jgi:RecA/RadA recombinase
MAKEKSYDIDSLVKKYSREIPMIEDRYISTRYLAIDYAFSDWGMPENRIISIYSDPGVGKSLLALCIACTILESIPDSIVLYLDVERGITGSILRNIFGVDYETKYINRLIILSPDSYEQAEGVIADFAKTGRLKFVVMDSLSALQTANDLKNQQKGEGNMVGGKSRSEGPFLNYVKILTSSCNFSALFLNQVTANFGGSSWSGPSTKMKGSNALPHFSSVIFRLSNKEVEKNSKDERIGAMVQITNTKNRVNGNRISYAYFRYGHGISNTRTILEFLTWAGIAKGSGAWFTIVDPGFDFGRGLGVEIKVQGYGGVLNVVKEKLSEIVEYYRKDGKLKEFFDAYKFV